MADEQREKERLDALDRYDVLDTPREEAFDRITRLVRRTFDVPIAVVSVIDGHRQWHKSCDGVPAGEAPRQQTFCTYTIQQDQPLVIPDATLDPRFAQNPYVIGEPGIRAYAGVPLRTSDGHNIGTLCAVDTRPRDFSPAQLEMLSDFADLAMHELDLRLVAGIDGLTGAWSRRAFKNEGNRAAALALRHHHDLSCIVLDLDHFKTINDRFQHAGGDRVLQGVAQSCVAQLRQADIFGRLGGEEFGFLLPHTDRDGAFKMAERVRTAIGALRFDLGVTTVAITASFGVASLSRAIRDFDELLKCADSALYEAKGLGRNRSVAWRGPEAETDTGRRRVLKGAQILFNGRNSSIDCTVRSLSDVGAGIDLSDAIGVPKLFELAIKADGFNKQCRILSKTERHIEVEFCPSPNGSSLAERRASGPH